MTRSTVCIHNPYESQTPYNDIKLRSLVAKIIDRMVVWKHMRIVKACSSVTRHCANGTNHRSPTQRTKDDPLGFREKKCSCAEGLRHRSVTGLVCFIFCKNATHLNDLRLIHRYQVCSS